MYKHRILAALTLALLPASLASAQVKLALQFAENVTQLEESRTVLKQNLTLGGQKINTAMDSTSMVKTVFGKRDANGAIPATMTFDSMKAEMQLPNPLGGAAEKLTFDSANPGAKAANPAYDAVLDLFRRQLELEIKYVVGKNNEIGKVEGLDNNPLMKPEQMQQELQQHIDRFPPTEVNAGETWKRTSTIFLGEGQKFIVEQTMTYQGPQAADGTALDKIEVKTESVKYEMDGQNAAGLSVKPTELKVLDSSGTILFDRAKGQAASTTTSFHVSGTLSLSAAGMEIPAELDLTMENSTKLSD